MIEESRHRELRQRLRKPRKRLAPRRPHDYGMLDWQRFQPLYGPRSIVEARCHGSGDPASLLSPQREFAPHVLQQQKPVELSEDALCRSLPCGRPQGLRLACLGYG